MKTRAGSPPISAPYKVQTKPGEKGKNISFDAMWETDVAPPNTLVGLRAVSRVPIENVTVEIKIFQMLDGRRNPVDLLQAKVENGRIQTHWRTKPAKGGNFEAGVYHFEINYNGYSSQTVKPLLLRDIMRRNESIFETAKPKPKISF
jgi:hypothetical protein